MRTVLVVDDEPASRRAVERALDDECRVLAAAGAGEALRLLDTEAVALMISDQRMPDMLGTRLLEECTVRFPDVIRILLTGYTEVETLLDSINAGHVWAYLTKPWEPRELRLVVRRGLERFDTGAENRSLLVELRAACERARAEAEQKGRLLALAAHELGTPVHIATNAVELVDTMMPAGTETKRWLDSAREALAWLSRGVEQLHRAGEWNSGGVRISKTPFDLGGMLKRLMQRFEIIVRRRRLHLETQIDPALGWFDGDERWLERAICNLIANAVRFTPDGGYITLAASPGAIEVRDTGVGIDAAVLACVFEPFSAAGGDIALHSSGQFEFGSRGLGLGLALAKAIVEAHGGGIELESAMGQGTTVRVVLPSFGT